MPDSFLYILAVMFCAAAGVAWIFTIAARRLALAIDLVDHPGERKIHEKVMPYGGGVAIVATVFLFLVGGYAAVLYAPWDVWLPSMLSFLEAHREGMCAPMTLRRLGAICGGGLFLFIVGLMDDRRGMSAKAKLLCQILAALLLVAVDVRITLFIDNIFFSSVLTVLWVVLLTNAFNLLDNMDGLSVGVALVASLFFLVIAVQGENVFVAAFLAIFAGAMLGFLQHNFAPARLFMGDAGALYIGYTLAALTVAGTYYAGKGSVYAAAMPLLVLGVPLFDTLSVMWIRWRAGKPLYIGDTNHVSHRLVRLGMTRREAVLTIYLLGAVLGGMATLLRELSPAGAVVVLLIGVGVIALIVLLESAAARRNGNGQG